MGQPPRPQPDAQSLLDYLQALEPVKSGVEAQPEWMNVTIIEDDDLTFGGKPLSTLYEEDRRRYSLGEESVAALAFDVAQEEERRGRQRDRPHYHKPSHKHHHHQHHHHHKKTSKAEDKKH